MKLSTSFVALISLASMASASALPSVKRSSSSCNAADRIPVSSRTVSAGGFEFQIATKACSKAVSQATPLTPRSLAKRQYNSCAAGETQNFFCVNGGTAPLAADCQSLQTALQSYIANNSNPRLFTVPAGYVEEFTLGTCQHAWFNENPNPPGVYLQYCYSGVYLMASTLLGNGCVINGHSGGYVVASNPDLVPESLNWIFEIYHA